MAQALPSQLQHPPCSTTSPYCALYSAATAASLSEKIGFEDLAPFMPRMLPHIGEEGDGDDGGAVTTCGL